jgi:hypothetical protein
MNRHSRPHSSGFGCGNRKGEAARAAKSGRNRGMLT